MAYVGDKQQNMFALIIFKFNAPTNKFYAIYKDSISVKLHK